MITYLRTPRGLCIEIIGKYLGIARRYANTLWRSFMRGLPKLLNVLRLRHGSKKSTRQRKRARKRVWTLTGIIVCKAFRKHFKARDCRHEICDLVKY